MNRIQLPTTTFQKLSRRRQPDDKGLTLIELLMVITILGILAGIAFFSAQNFRGQATAAADETDSDVVRTAQEAYCFKTGDYADRLRDMLTAPNNVLAEPQTFNGSVAYAPEVYTGFGTDDPDDSVFKAYRAGGAVDPDTPPDGCNGRSLLIGPLTDVVAPRGGAGPRVLADATMKGTLDFLGDSFRQLFGSVQFGTDQPIGLLNDKATGVVAPATEDWLVISTAAPTDPPGQASTFRLFATGQLTLMACRAGALALPTTNQCRAPGYAPVASSPDLFSAEDADDLTMPALEAALAGAPTNCGANPILVMEPSTTLFGNTARQALITEGVAGTTIDALAGPTRNCIVYGSDLTAAQTLLQSGGKAVGGASVNPVKYALLSKTATTDPRAVDGNWKRDVAGFDLFASVLAAPPASNLANQAQARRFLNYLLSPAGQQTLENYGFGKVPQAERTPLPENNE